MAWLSSSLRAGYRGLALGLGLLLLAGAEAHAQAQGQAHSQGQAAPAPSAKGTTEGTNGSAPAPDAPQPAPVPQAPPAPVLSADDTAAIEDIRRQAAELKSTLERLEKSVERNLENDEELPQIRVDILALMERAQAALDALTPKAAAQRQLVEKLGPAPDKGATAEADQVAAERGRLNAILAETDGALKSADLAQARARQLLATVQTARQALFAKQILRRSPSPLLPGTWEQVLADVPGAKRQVSYALSHWSAVAARKWQGLAALLAGAVLVFAVGVALVRRFLAYRLNRPREKPPTFFAQAATAGWVAPLLALPALAAIGLLAGGLDSLGLLILDIGDIARTAFPALLAFVAVAALARAVLSPSRPDWRAVDLSTPAATTLTRLVTAIAAVFFIDVILRAILEQLYLPLSISILETAIAGVVIGLLMLKLARTPFEPKESVASPGGQSGSEAATAAGGPPPARPVSWLRPALLKIPLVIAALALLVLTLAGYISLGRFITTQLVVTGSAIVLVLVLHLAIRALLGEPGTGVKPLATVLEERVGLAPDQSTALTRTLSLALNAALALLALPLILLTWGYSLPEALAWLKAAVFGFEIGDIRISFARIVIAVVLFLVLVFLTRILQRWIDTALVGSRRVDPGIANSVHTGIGYSGFIIAALLAVSYAGLDITNFAIVAGALSVGIGFGLQSIVNNFVSGLILLVERPIKVGDRVSVKGQEGFVRRISVRSTEIETADKSSLIVPNSDFITSSVTNWTHRNTLGQVTVKVAASYRADAERVRALLEAVGAECPLVLQHPPPGVTLDNFGANGLEFTLAAVIPDVTKAGTVQTDLRMRILKAFRATGIEMPYAQTDVHLRDLDLVRAIVTKLAEDRARQTNVVSEPSGAKPPKGD
jgi:potassium efflux system protein